MEQELCPRKALGQSGCFGPVGLSEGLDLQGINSFCRVVVKAPSRLPDARGFGRRHAEFLSIEDSLAAASEASRAIAVSITLSLSRVAQPLGFCPHRSERTDFPYSALLEVYPDFSRRPPPERQPDGVEGEGSARAAVRTGPSSNAADCGAPAHGTRCVPPGSESLPACASFLAGRSRRSARPRPCKASDADTTAGQNKSLDFSMLSEFSVGTAVMLGLR